MAEKEFYVRAVDQDGKVLVDEKITTLRNGFFELWLPRERRIGLRIEALNRKAIGMIETFDHSKTCVTTFRLR
ncbi:MAG: hypothetical protein GTO12_11740 [Proteobacteria bacterium]|nr:hypothetical protein [Pseudomonadota bacterium]